MTEIITIAEDHSVSYSSGAFVLNLTIDNQNAVDRIEFVLPESVGNPADWAWRVEISQNGETSWVALADDVVWVPRAGAVTYGKCELQLVGVQPAEDGSYNRVWKSRMFKANVLESINAIVDAEQASELDDIVLKVEGYKDAAEASAQAAASSASAAQAAQTEAEAAQDAAEDAQNAAETAQGKAEAAQAAAETAQTGAETARTQAQEAQNAAVTAQGKAEDAQEAAEAAQAAAEGAAEDLSAAVASAAQSASSAAQSATDASGYASAASSSATAAAGSATTAQGHASAAQTARAGAESAQSAAETAQGHAEDAQEAAETARNAAQSAQSAAESAKSSAEAAKSGAETAKTAAETAAGNASDDADEAASSASAAAQSAQAAQEAAQTALGIIDDEAVAADSTWSSKQIIDALCPPLEATGNPVQCYPVAGYPLGVKASWEPRQEGEGDPSPGNVRPISGRNQVTVTKCGKNLLNPEIVTAISGAYGLTVTYENENIFHIVGTPNNPDNGKLSFVVAETLDYSLAGKGLAVTALNLSGNLTEVSAYGLRTSTEKVIAISAYLDNTVTYDARIQLAVGVENLATYEPYTGTTATLSLPETIYGGTVDAVTGEGEKTWEFVEFDGTEDWYKNGEAGYFLGDVIDGGQAGHRESISNIAVNSEYTIDPIPPGQFNAWSFQTQTGWIGFSLSFADSLDSWKSHLSAQAAAGTPVQVAYKLATNASFQATGGQPIPALPGANTIYTDADSVTVTGRADPSHTIQTLSDRIAALEDEIAEGGINA